ncbi:putative ternary complex factor MIP1, leucine-zipper [Rosa chinensis]|uniref:Putative ternary complex factor MIP1, leucine-zipper n=2 Tax=Rosa chinensis TaxID=74649 RepID=A0A2P6P8I1_ROSCH|nr:uncharacterized protein LOC112176851 isoform X1 [Rosa chinensis]PRQ18222.1 putative ternary complex factor MIP1, leucine-zipper [Rosa chinensis]
MVGFICNTVGEKDGCQEQAGGKRENGDSGPRSDVHTQHRRSKSASDKNFGIRRGRVLSSTKKDKNETQVSSPSTSASTGQSPWHENPIYFNKNMSLNNRASLEKDIEQLQLRLQEEKSMRNMLERAMGRASSTLSPGHRHFSVQTKELISEIELLEEEVANREQHVLSLYRSIFEQCVSKPPSEQNSLVASPAHMKNGSRKHPSIISSAFCSAKNFPFRHFRALVAIDDSGKRASKTSHTPLSSGKSDIDFAKTRSNLSKVEKVRERVPVLGKTSMMRTLKDHLHQCPSKLAEEMIRCMSLVYCWLCSAASEKIEKNQSPLLSRSSTNVLQPPHGTEDAQDWSGKSMVEISWISTDKRKSSHASYAINNYRMLVEQLEKVDVTQMELDAQIAFWINVYNALLMHAYLAYGIPNSSLRRLALFHKAAYNIGGLVISANAIEQSIFGFQTPRIGRWLETFLSTALRKKFGEDRQLRNSKLGLPVSEPLVCFALCTGAFSDPALKVYTASNVRDELEEAKKDFIKANVVVKKSRKVFLPKMLERFSREASFGSDDLLKWVTDNVDEKLQDSIRKCIDHKSSKKASQIIEWLPYNSRFRYVFPKDLAEKPWWL